MIPSKWIGFSCLPGRAFPVLSPHHHLAVEQNRLAKVVTKLRFGCSPLKSQYSWEARVGRKGKIALLRSLATWGDGRLVSENQLWRFCSIVKVFKGKRGSWSQLIIWGRGQSLRHLSLCADLLTPGDLSLDAVLFTWFAHGIIEGEAAEKIWLSVNYLFLISPLT